MESHDQEHQLAPLDGARRSFLGCTAWVGVGVCRRPISDSGPALLFYPLTANAGDSDWAEAARSKYFPTCQTPMRRTLDLKQRDGWRETSSQPVVYIIKSNGDIKALSAICTHLGCTVPWDPGRNEFVCPCHGGTFSRWRPSLRTAASLARFAETKVSGGKLMVKYQYFRPDVPNKEVPVEPPKIHRFSRIRARKKAAAGQVCPRVCGNG